MYIFLKEISLSIAYSKCGQEYEKTFIESESASLH